MKSSSIFDGKGVPLRFFVLSALTGAGSYRMIGSFPLCSALLGYCAANYLSISYFTLRNVKDASVVIGKDRLSGQLQLWSYVAWWPFHVINRAFAAFITTRPVELATEIFPNYYVGCWYAHEMNIEWEAVLDLTCELPKKTNTKHYLNLPSWDGSVNYEELQQGAAFGAKHGAHGPVLVHCAHGVGRSTTYMRAVLVEAGLVDDVDEAFKVIKAKRSVAKSSGTNQALLQRWQRAR